MDIGGLTQKVVIRAASPLLEALHAIAVELSEGLCWNDALRASPHLGGRICRYQDAFKSWRRVEDVSTYRRTVHGISEMQTARNKLVGKDGCVLNEEVLPALKRLDANIAKMQAEKTRFDELAKKGPVPLPAKGASSVQVLSGQLRYADGGMLHKDFIGMTDEVLKHRLILDSTYRIGGDDGVLTEARLAHELFSESREHADFKAVADDMNATPPVYSGIVSVLREIRVRLQSVARVGVIRNELDELIDVDAIEVSIKAGSVSPTDMLLFFDRVVAFIIKMHSRIGAYERAKETSAAWGGVRALAEPMVAVPETVGSGVCKGLEFMAGRVYTLRIDVANFSIMSMIPKLRANGVDYEKNNFQKALDEGRVALDRTNVLVARVVCDLANATQEPRVASFAKPEDFDKLYAAMGAEVVAEFPRWATEDEPDGGSDFPETMRLDTEHLHSLHLRFRSQVATCAALLGVEQCLGVSMGARPQEIANAVAAVRDALINTPPVASIPQRTVNLAMEAVCNTLSEEVAVHCGTAVTRMLDPRCVVHASVHKAYKRHLAVSVLKNGLPDRARVAPVCADARMDSAFSDVVKKLRMIVDLNGKVHGARYRDMVVSAKGGGV